jgi:uncharacterized peroxidase-related enzyme
MPEDLRSRIKEVAEKSGFVPNIFLSLARRPAEWRAFFAYHDALMDKETPALSKGDRELIVVATSAENRCLYCVVAHGAIARIRARNPRIADQVATDWRSAELDDRQRAILDVAVKLAVEPWTVSDEVLGSLRVHGLTDDDIWDVGSISAFFAMSNRLAHLTSTMPNEEFYLLGRLPRTPSALPRQPDDGVAPGGRAGGPGRKGPPARPRRSAQSVPPGGIEPGTTSRTGSSARGDAGLPYVRRRPSSSPAGWPPSAAWC